MPWCMFLYFLPNGNRIHISLKDEFLYFLIKWVYVCSYAISPCTVKGIIVVFAYAPSSYIFLTYQRSCVMSPCIFLQWKVLHLLWAWVPTLLQSYLLRRISYTYSLFLFWFEAQTYHRCQNSYYCLGKCHRQQQDDERVFGRVVCHRITVVNIIYVALSLETIGKCWMNNLYLIQLSLCLYCWSTVIITISSYILIRIRNLSNISGNQTQKLLECTVHMSDSLNEKTYPLVSKKHQLKME